MIGFHYLYLTCMRRVNPKTPVLLVAALILSLFLFSFVSSSTYARQGADLREICYAVANEGSDYDSLVTVNFATTQVKPIGEINGKDEVEAIAFVPSPDPQGIPVLYAVNEGSREGEFGTLNLQTGQFALIGKLGRADGDAGPKDLKDIDGMAYDSKSSTMFGVARQSGGRDLLFEINLTSGTFINDAFGEDRDYVQLPTVQGKKILNDVDDIAVDRDGQMYGVINDEGDDDFLITINKETGELIKIIGRVIDETLNDTVDDLEGLAFGSDGNLYGSTGDNGPDDRNKNRLYVIDKEDGTAIVKGRFEMVADGANNDIEDIKDIEALGCLTTITESSLPLIKKFTNGVSASDANDPNIPVVRPGETVTWTYHATIRKGNGPLKNVSVIDDKLAALEPPVTPAYVSGDDGDGLLELGETWIYQASGVAPPANEIVNPVPGTCGGIPNTPLYQNIVTLKAETETGEFVEDQDKSHYCVTTDPKIDIEKATNGVDADDPTGPQVTVGNDVIWSYVVTNIGDTDLKNVSVTDDLIGTISCPADTLAIAASMTCTAEGTATVGQYKNLSTAIGYSVVDNQMVDDEDPSHYIGILPTVNLEKEAKLSWSYTVTNAGDPEDPRYLSYVDISLTIEGSPPLPASCTQTKLAPGSSMRCSVVEGPAERYSDTAIVRARREDRSDYETIAVVPDPLTITGLELVTKLEGNLASPIPRHPVDEKLNWGFDLQNGSGFNLDRVTVVATDLLTTNSITVCEPGILDRGASHSCNHETTTQEGSTHFLISARGFVVGTDIPVVIDHLQSVEGYKPASVGGHVFIDTIRTASEPNGRYESDEIGLIESEIIIELHNIDGESIGRTTPSSEGRYSFGDLVPGDYYLSFKRPSAPYAKFFQWTNPNQANDAIDSDAIPTDSDSDVARSEEFSLASGQVDLRWNVGFKQLRIDGRAGYDTNGNGRLDLDEPGQSQVQLLLVSDGKVVKTTTTGDNGIYELQGVNPGRYDLQCGPGSIDCEFKGSDIIIPGPMIKLVYLPVAYR